MGVGRSLPDARYVDHPLTIAAMVWVGLAGGYSTVLLPLLVPTIAAQFGVAALMAGRAASAEMAGVALGSFASGFLVPAMNRRRLAVSGAIALTLTNLASIIAPTFLIFTVSRLGAGFFAGSLLAVMAAGIGSTARPDRNFAFFVAAAFGAAAGGFQILTPIVALSGLPPILAALTACAMLAVIAALRFPSYAASRPSAEVRNAEKPRAPSRLGGPAILSLAGILAYYLGLGTVWPLMVQIGSAIGLPPGEAASVLAKASMFAIIGSAMAVVFGSTPGRMASLSIGLTVLAMSMASLALVPKPSVFIVIPFLFLFFWNYTVPYMMGTVAVLDRSGKAVAFNMTLQYVGFTIGPIIAGPLSAALGISGVPWLAAASFILSLLFFVFAIAMSERNLAVE